MDPFQCEAKKTYDSTSACESVKCNGSAYSFEFSCAKLYGIVSTYRLVDRELRRHSTSGN